MAFTNALFYPWIDIENGAWLKTAMLYWDEIQTIVPYGLEAPYTGDAAEFADAGHLIPLYVQPEMDEVVALADDALRYIRTAEGREAADDAASEYPSLARELRYRASIHPRKLAYAVRRELERAGHIREGRVEFGLGFPTYYMTLLATRLADQRGLGLLTDLPRSEELSVLVRRDIEPHMRTRAHERRQLNTHDRPPMRHQPRLVQGIMFQIVAERLQIVPDVPPARIVRFKAKHGDELGRFRTAMAGLVRELQEAESHEALQQGARDLTVNEVMPALGSLKASLRGARIKWVGENFIKVGFFSTATSSLPVLLLNIGAPYAVAGGVAMSIVAAATGYSVERRTALRENPFSYLMAVEEEFRRG